MQCNAMITTFTSSSDIDGYNSHMSSGINTCLFFGIALRQSMAFIFHLEIGK